MITVGEIMSSPPITCRADDTLDQAARRMWDHDCGSVIVTSSDGQLAGIITDRDICMAAYTGGRSLHEIRVADIMAKQVCYCQTTAPVRWALLLMAHYQVRRLPVVGVNARPVGLISLNNLIRYSAWADDRFRQELLETMGRVCQPRRVELEHETRHVSGIFEIAHLQRQRAGSERES